MVRQEQVEPVELLVQAEPVVLVVLVEQAEQVEPAEQAEQVEPAEQAGLVELVERVERVDATSSWRGSAGDRVTLVCGSCFLVGEARAHLLGIPFPECGLRTTAR